MILGLIMEKKPGANGNAYSSSKRLYELIRVTEENTIASSHQKPGTRANGGVIVLARDESSTLIDRVKNIKGIGWTVGRFFGGRYQTKNGTAFSENSLSVEIVGIREDELIRMAEEIYEKFDQKAALVKCYESGRIVLINSNT